MNCEHFNDSIMYQLELTTAYCREKGEQVFKELNIGLTPEQFAALDVILLNPGICQMDLAKLILKDRAYTSRVINVLENQDLVKRKVQTKGKRLVNTLFITKNGKMLYEDVFVELRDTFEGAFAEFTEQELEDLKKGIQKLKECASRITVMPL